MGSNCGPRLGWSGREPVLDDATAQFFEVSDGDRQAPWADGPGPLGARDRLVCLRFGSCAGRLASPPPKSPSSSYQHPLVRSATNYDVFVGLTIGCPRSAHLPSAVASRLGTRLLVRHHGYSPKEVE